MNQIEYKCEFKALGEDGDISGHGAAFNNIDHGLDRIEPGAFKAALSKLNQFGIPMLWNHHSDEVIGKWDRFAEDSKGLVVDGRLNMDVTRARETRALVKQGAVDGLSIGYIPREFDFDDDIRVLKRIDVVEVSLTPFPMNERARVTNVKDVRTRADWVKELRGLGLTKNDAEAFVAKGLAGLRSGKRDRREDDRSAEVQEIQAAIQRLHASIASFASEG